MTDIEELLARTLRDPERALPVPADPLPAIRTLARMQRRHAVLAVAVMALLATTAVLVPAAVRLTRPAPVATDPTPGAGLLPWSARGPLAGDGGLVREAVRNWPGVSGVQLLWAGPVGAERVVLLQAVAGGRPTLAQVAGREGALRLVRTEPVLDPATVAVRLAGPAGTVLLVRPGGAAVAALTAGEAEPLPVGADGVASAPGDLAGRWVAVLEGGGRIIGEGTLPARGTLLAARGPVRLVAPAALAGRARVPRMGDYADGLRLAARLGRAVGPVELAVVDSAVDLGPGHVAVARFYEVAAGGERWTGAELRVDGRPSCLRLDRSGSPDAVVLRCPVPALRAGVVAVALHRGIRLAGVRLGAFEQDFATPAEPGWVHVTDADFPTGAGELQLVDDSGLPRPPLRLPPYRP